ncbi:chemotaxis protein CheW [Pseudomonas sp.]|uniref:chemotaxis protein CheW n=1 Tax=Pseudomonas sp. TaxID=306 RepID=UPI002734A542|nr:chemotaxis protein CheW [Pseudomonas sp.]MDP3814681.1 chemotaxis protein CheW [Pseudomonas sp.]
MSEPLEDQLRWTQLHKRMSELEQRLVDGFGLRPDDLAERLRLRTQQWAGQRDSEAALDLFEVLSFSLSGELYAIGSEHVAQVLPLNHYTPLPSTPAYVLGIVNVRGRIVSVLDLRVLFELPIGHLSDRSFLLILQSPEMEFGLLIDRVLGVAQISRDGLQTGLANLSGVRANYLLGVSAQQCTVLDGARLLGDPNLRVLADE